MCVCMCVCARARVCVNNPNWFHMESKNQNGEVRKYVPFVTQGFSTLTVVKHRIRYYQDT